MKKRVFETTNIGGICVKNRIIRSATQELMSENGTITDRMKKMYKDLSEGGVGLIITGFLTFSSTDNHIPIALSIENHKNEKGLNELTDLVHSNETMIVAQLAHLGSQIKYLTNNEVYAPSDVVDPYANIKPKSLTLEQVKLIIKEFGRAALKAKKYGFDGVQLHAAHGYLLSKFLSPVYNKRTDEYGGSPENNSRIIIEILDEIKNVCGKDYPVWIKMNCADFDYDDDSLQFEDIITTAKMLEANNIDAIELSGGTSSGKLNPARSNKYEAYHLRFANKLASEISTDIISVGGFRKIETIESALLETNVAAVSMCRALIREPNLPKFWMEQGNKKAKCIACNCCFNPKGVTCIFNLNEEKRKEHQAFLKQFRAK